MKISSETKIGLLTAVTLAILIIGYRFLKGSNLFDRSKIYYAVFKDVQMLDASAPVLARGIKVGTVIKVELKSENPDSVVVTLDVKSKIKLPQNCKAVLISTGIIGGKAIELRFDHHCIEDCVPNKSYLNTEVPSLLSGMFPKNEFEEYTKLLSASLDTLFSSTGVKTEVNAAAQDVKATLHNLAKVSEQLEAVMSASSHHINQSLKNVDVLTTSLTNDSKAISQSLENISVITKQVKDADPGKLVKDANATINHLDQTLTEGKKSIAQLNQVITQIEQGKGSLGKLINDPNLYKNLEKTSKNLEYLLQDMRLNPNRYIHISVFGSKNKPYEGPVSDPVDNIK
ncbi:MAG: MCE family protein [Saprospiraceae bacterium]|nr:MCE family protein [Candidatus Vicinibacter affinis]